MGPSEPTLLLKVVTKCESYIIYITYIIFYLFKFLILYFPSHPLFASLKQRLSKVSSVSSQMERAPL